MDQHRQNSRQYTGNVPVTQAATTSSPSAQLRHRPSFRDRFWTKTSANYFDGEDDVTHEPQVNPTKKSAYVPMNAASGFSRTVTAPQESIRRRNERRSSKESAINVNASSPLSELAAGHLYVHTESEPGTTDFADFITAAQAEERLRRAANTAHARNQYRDSGYYSSSNGGRHDHGPYSSSLPSTASAAGPKKLKSQPSMKAFGQRLVEYIKPPRDDSVPPIRR